MVDREARNRLSGMLTGLVNGDVTVEDIQAERVNVPYPDDPAIQRIEQTLTWLFPRLHRLNSGRSAKVRRMMARSIAFLRTDQEFVWARRGSLPWWLSVPGAIVVLAGLLLCFEASGPLKQILTRFGIGDGEGFFLFIPCYILAIALLVLFDCLSNRINGREPKYWPFANRGDYEFGLGSQSAALEALRGAADWVGDLRAMREDRKLPNWDDEVQT
jgi:hypothetical protein